MLSLLKRLALFALAFAPLAVVADDDKGAPPKPKQFVYVLRLVPRLHDDNAWTEADKKAVGVHFAHLKAAAADGKVILAGRTTEPGDRTFGLVIFEAADEPSARTFMNSDPGVREGIMTAELHPYQVAVQRK
ncbi:MAG: YciI family protein [Opitutaceae bacterium]|nr:YciI family protein [Opitutaceae bacterium]